MRLGPSLVNRSILTDADQLSFALLCQAWADWQDAIAAIRESGLVVTTEAGTVYQHPAVGIRNRAWLNVMKGCQEFGLTASARMGMDIVQPAGDGEESPEVADILGIGPAPGPAKDERVTALAKSKKRRT